MANAATPVIPILLDKMRTLRFDFNALSEYEEATGESAMNGVKLNSIRNLRALLWAGLVHEDPTLTLQDVGAMIHAGNAQDVAVRIAEAFGLAMPAASETADSAAAEEGQALGNAPTADSLPSG